MSPRILSVRENPEITQRAIAWFQKTWASPASAPVYQDCITHCVTAPGPLPQWYLLLDAEGRILGGAGLVPNDFISRMDLNPWLCALYIEPEHRGHAYGSLLIDRVCQDARAAGFENLYLASDHVGYYERYGFQRIATGYHPWGGSSGIFQVGL